MNIRTEVVHLDRLKQLASLRSIVDTANDASRARKAAKKGKKVKKDRDEVPLIAMVRMYLKQFKEGGSVNVQYIYKQFLANNDPIGRRYPNSYPSLTFLPHNLRNYVTEGLYWDVDMDNSNFRLISSCIQGSELDPCPQLEKYIANRDKYLEKYNMDKMDVFEMMMYQKCREDAPKFFQLMHKYIYEILVPNLKEEFGQIWNHTEAKATQEDAMYNVEGRFLSAVLSTMEDGVLQDITTFFEDRGYSVDVYIFDGCLVRKNENPITDEILSECEEYIQENDGMYIKLKLKPMEVDEDFRKNNLVHAVMPDERFSLGKAKRLYEDFGENTYMQYVNNFVCKLTEDENAMCNYRNITSEPWLLRDRKTFTSSFSHQNFLYIDEGENGKPKKVEVKLIHCLDNPAIRTFRRLAFEPNSPGDVEGEHINMFRGFAASKVEDVDMDKVDWFLEHIRTVLCDGDKDLFVYMVHWLASVVQCPGVKTKTAPVFFGSQGAGKNILFEFFGDYIIKKEHYFYTNSIDQITGQFNDQLARAIFVICDEVTFAGAHKQNNILKSKITQETQPWEKKYHNQKQIKDFKNYIFLSNNADAVRIEGDNDQRFVVSVTSDCHLGDEDYFIEFASKCTEENANHVYTFLLQTDLSAVSLRKFPKTKARADMAEFTKSDIDKFVDQLMDGQIHRNRNQYEVVQAFAVGTYFKVGVEYETSAAEMWALYKLFAPDVKNSWKSEFSKQLKKRVNVKDKFNYKVGGTPWIMKVEHIPSSIKRKVEEMEE